MERKPDDVVVVMGLPGGVRVLVLRKDQETILRDPLGSAD